jgi:hypothetical protein
MIIKLIMPIKVKENFKKWKLIKNKDNKLLEKLKINRDKNNC